MVRSCPTQRGPLRRGCQAALHGWRSPCAEQGGSGISAGRVPWSRREEEKKLLCDCQAPLVAQRTTSHLPLGCRSVRRGKEGEKEKAREPCLPATISIPLFFQREQPARVPRWRGSRCLGANCALFVCRRDVPSSLRDGDAVRFHRVTPRPQRGGTLARALHIAHAEAARAELAAMHRQHHSPVLPAMYIGASRQERLLSPSEQHCPVYFLEAFQDALLQATLRSPLAPRQGVRMNGRSWSPPAFGTAMCRHTALGMARRGWEAHAKPRGSGTGLPCSEPSALLSSGHQPSAG